MRRAAISSIAIIVATSAVVASSPAAAETITVDTWGELDSAAGSCADGDVIRLGDDIVAGAGTRLDFGCTVITLDLNDHSLTITDPNTGEAAVAVPAGTDLTIVDTGPDPILGALDARGGSRAAGIGGDRNEDGGAITIDGGTVAARGSNFAAGIGGGEAGGGGTITINGGTITAEGDNGAGIGGGVFGDGGMITINGGTITARGGSFGAGIGGGTSGGGAATTINGGTITAEGGAFGAGIGGGNGGGGAATTINGGTITAEGGAFGAGIGGGNRGDGGMITINGGTTDARADGFAAGIGGGDGGDGGMITINGGSVAAVGGGRGGNDFGGGAGIGGGDDGDGGTITITGGTVTAWGGGENPDDGDAAGIGAGNEANGGEVTISGGTVTAIGSYAGVGAADGRSPGVLTLVGTPLIASTASTGSPAAGVAPDVTIQPGAGYYTATDTPDGEFWIDYSDATIERRSGATRIDTAIDTSRHRFDDDEAGAVVLARADQFPDALVGGPLAALLDAPLLLTTSDTLPAEVLAEIDRVLPAAATVYVLGGTAAITPTVTEALLAAGYDVTRYSGPTRYDTATAVADAVVALSDDDTTALVATGGVFPDALTASAAGADAGWPVLLTNDDQPTTQTTTWLASSTADTLVCVGGPACRAHPTSDISLIGGDRYATAVAVAEEFFTPGTTIGLASGQAFPDALIAAADTPDRDGPLVLTRTNQLPAATATFISTWGSAEFRIYGGTNAISDTVIDALR